MIKIRHIFYILAICWIAQTESFETLSDLQTYASQHIENPKSDDEAWVDPDFTGYHKSLNPTFKQRFLRFWGLEKTPEWTIESFDTILHETLAQRKKAELGGRKIAHVQLSQPANLIVWGNLEGSFHSLVRALSWLHKEGIINANLEIIKEDYYLVFFGSSISRTAYILETLTTLMLLLQRNPEKVIYLRGDNEDHEGWRNYGLKRELLARSNQELTGAVPFDAPISEFFNTLPLAFYTSTTKEPLSLIRISTTGLDNPEINEQMFGTFWNNPPKDTLRYYDISQKKESTQKIKVKVIIKSEDWMIETRSVHGFPSDKVGLGFLNQDHGATAWSILSGPNIARQKYLDFDYDTFGLVHVTPAIKDSEITLYNHKISVKDASFTKHEPLNLLSGIPAKNEGLLRKDIVIGSTLGLSAGLPVMSKEIIRGISTRIEIANVSQEFKGTHLSLITYNDDYTPELAYNNVVKLTQKDNALVILLPTGSPTLKAYVDLIKQDKILTLFPVTGNPSFFHEDLKGLINYRASYGDEVSALIDHVIVKKTARKFAFFYQDDAYGLDTLEAAHQALKRHNITTWIDIPYQRGNTDFKHHAEIVKKESPDAIGFFSAALPTREFLRQLGTDNAANKTLFGISFLGEESIRTYIKRQGLHFLFGAVVPDPETSELPIVQQYRKDIDAKKYPYNIFSLEAYIGTCIFLDALHHVKEPTRNNIKKYLESLKNYDFKGIPLSFNPKTRSLSTKIWIEMDRDQDWIELDIATLK